MITEQTASCLVRRRASQLTMSISYAWELRVAVLVPDIIRATPQMANILHMAHGATPLFNGAGRCRPVRPNAGSRGETANSVDSTLEHLLICLSCAMYMCQNNTGGAGRALESKGQLYKGVPDVCEYAYLALRCLCTLGHHDGSVSNGGSTCNFCYPLLSFPPDADSVLFAPKGPQR